MGGLQSRNKNTKSRHDGGMKLTKEQQAILETLPPPALGTGQRGKLIRITAAAGAGKTTTLLELAEAAAGKHSIVYLTFSKAAAEDGKKRFSSRRVYGIDARTLHSAAYGLVWGDNKDVTLWHESDIKQWVAKTCRAEIDEFLIPCHAELSRRRGTPEEIQYKKESAREKVVFFIFKSLEHFCQSKFSVEEYSRTGYNTPFNRDYYPAKIYHSDQAKGGASGFPERIYANRIHFYAEQAIRLWELVEREGHRAFGFDMKRVQLKQLHRRCSLLLLDECQDMDECQVDWIRQHTKNGTHVYLVGDLAQAIYQFRGAKPKYLREIRVDKDMELTESFRFGKAVSNMANLILYTKENSDQNCSWTRYRVKTGTNKVSHVTSDSLLPQWREQKLTLIGRSNTALFLEALKLLGLHFDDAQDEETIPFPVIDRDNIPKIHINGRGEKSGLRKWKLTIKMVQEVYNLCGNPVPQILDRKLFPDFNGRKVSWNQFTAEVENKELNDYGMAVEIVQQCGRKTPALITAFEELVIRHSYSAEEAHIILTTCHSAKGMEWDNVQLCDDFIDMCCFKKQQDCGINTSRSDVSPSKRQRTMDKWSFAFDKWDGGLNLLYVACTRAKKNLCIPDKVQQLITKLDNSLEVEHIVRQGGSLLSFSIPGPMASVQMQLSKNDLESFNSGLVKPLRDELNAPRSLSLWSLLITDSNESSDEAMWSNIITPTCAPMISQTI